VAIDVPLIVLTAVSLVDHSLRLDNEPFAVLLDISDLRMARQRCRASSRDGHRKTTNRVLVHVRDAAAVLASQILHDRAHIRPRHLLIVQHDDVPAGNGALRRLHLLRGRDTRHSQPEQRRTHTPRLCHHRNNSFVLLAVPAEATPAVFAGAR
jgi:hypothetical protein